jgi:hypothetical protein
MNLAAWGNFYAIVGGCAGGLIGLQFVVITLVGNSSKPVELATIDAFGTPTVVNFGSALTISAVVSAPWPSPLAVAIPLLLGGIAGLAYSTVVFRRARRQSGYKPDLEDWIWYVIVPCGIYAMLTIGAAILPWRQNAGSFVVGGAVLALLLVGVRDAWDTVIHLTVAHTKPPNGDK